MIAYDHFTLANGLRVLVHRVPDSQMAVCNLMYKVGSGDEQPWQTGIAHLFEHVMFSPSKHVPSYDKALQAVGGQNNAYTTFDVTNYYCVLPSANLETAFWLESDRMLYPRCTAHHLAVQQKVVTEEFNQTCFNRPYGDAWHHLLALAYADHPYSWPTIGKEKAHIADVSLADIQAFGERFYTPANAVLVVAGGVEVETVQTLASRWFDEGKGGVPQRDTPRLEPAHQRKGTRATVSQNVPFNVFYQAYHIPGRGDDAYLSLQCLAHLLSTGKSSLLYQQLVYEKGWLTDVEAFTTDMLHGGLWVVEGELTEGTSFAQVEEGIHAIVADACTMEIDDALWEKTKNQLASEYAFHHMGVSNRADSLAWSTWAREPSFFNEEVGARLAALEAVEMQEVGKRFLLRDEAVVLRYAKK